MNTARQTLVNGSQSPARDQLTGWPREIGVIGTVARGSVGLLLVASVVYGQLSSHLNPATWALGLIGFPAVVLVWHRWRIHRHPTPIYDTGVATFVLSVAVPLALYVTWWYAPAIQFTSDATLLFVGGSLLLAAFAGRAGCELLTPSNWLLGRHDQIACAVFTPIDILDRRVRRRHAA